MLKTAFAGLAAITLCLGAMTATASAEDGTQIRDKAATQFLGIDLDNGRAYYNGRNSGVYCLYKTVRVYNSYTGYFEWRRARRCGRGLYF